MSRAVPFRRLVDMVKWVYVDEAKTDLDASGNRPSKSAVALRTGLCRKEVPPRETDGRIGRHVTLLAHWRRTCNFRLSGCHRKCPG